MEEETNKIMRGAVETVLVTIDNDCTGHTCYLSIGDSKKCFMTAVHRQITTADGESTVRFELTQEETLACKPGEWSMQMRTVKDDDVAFATEWIPVTVGDAINKEVLEDVD